MSHVVPSHPAPPGAPPPGPGRGGRWSRTVRRFAAVAALATGAALAGPGAAGASATAPAEARAAAALERVTSFGANPGGLNMYVYRPATLPANAPVVVALHGCTQSAQVYSDNAGLNTFADRHGFLVVYAETTTANNASKCFNWFQPGDTRRGQGEAASIRQMVAHAATAYGADTGRVQVTGLSAGGAMTSVMLAAYPDVFAAGAVVAGIPYGCGVDVVSAFGCMSPGVDRTPAAWAQAVRDAHPGFEGPWPRVAIWHGDNDATVAPRNADELRDQWTAVHGLGQTPGRTSTIGPNSTRRSEYLSADGGVSVVEVNRVPGIGHGTPVDPGSGAEQCGATGTQHFIDSICSSYWITRFFGLDGTTTPEPPVDPPTEPAACWTANNYEHVRAGRATTTGGQVYAKGSGQHLGLYNTFVTHTLKESPAGHYVVADGSCP
ncbi:feruloyl esterase [Streptomyces sp. TSRI0445]|uniref:extracellular catalytic domain type 1 short-chain-length polyhydroxyalkanoate depolymerase n=2 Tax=Streptomyces TaxID=1883 RepID=UPI00093D11B4|nr:MULTISPECIES: PHB depolymerase family esterase [unclassified Streptomyces]WSQ90644.1 PHB depolymerase family esterase [Streptomyces globisporus]OKI67965.1 feruloyl esterase [Streptomyces sp. TSRI0445]UIZ16419.1 PHB depolymerase family esterase [Streptomyces sp. R527F]WSU79948.1 PHB depolymerase family esterase [Streptomyces globisporus]GGW03379.1 feruloyl esterase [Streptomyces globisporus]